MNQNNADTNEPGQVRERSPIARMTSFHLASLGSRGISMKDFAEILDVSYSTLSNWKNGRSEPDPLFLLRAFIHNQDLDAKEYAISALMAVAPELFWPPDAFPDKYMRAYMAIYDERGRDPRPQLTGFVRPEGMTTMPGRGFMVEDGETDKSSNSHK